MSDNHNFREQDGHILIWRFDTAPHWLQELFPEGRDCDWLARVPTSFDGDVTEWLQQQWELIYSPVKQRRLDDGWVIYLGEMQISKRILDPAVSAV